MCRKVWCLALILAPAGCRIAQEKYHWGASLENDRQRAAGLSDADLRRMVEGLYVEKDPDGASFMALRAAGVRAVPLLIRALDDPRTWNMTFPDPRYKLTVNSPFERIAGLLALADGIGAVKPAAKYLKHNDRWIRLHAASLLGGLATADCLEPVKLALADPDRLVRESALSGIRNGLGHRRDQTFIQGAFAAVLPMLNEGKYDTTTPAETLLAIDLARAVPILESPAYFSAANPQLSEVLSALNRGDVRVPRAILMPLMKQMEPREREYAKMLPLYARNPDAAAEAMFRSLVNSPSDSIAYEAAGALEILAGVEPWEVVKDGWEDRKFVALTQAQQYYMAVADYHGEVCNGGHRQYFYNSSAGHYGEAIAGLRAMGLAGKATILEKAAGAFAGGKPPLAWEPRRELVVAFARPAEAVLARADDAYFESEKKPRERVEVALALWTVAHRNEFVKPR